MGSASVASVYMFYKPVVRQCRPDQSVHVVAAQFRSALFASTYEIVNNDIKYVLSSQLKLKTLLRFIFVSALRVHWITIGLIMSDMIRVKYTYVNALGH